MTILKTKGTRLMLNKEIQEDLINIAIEEAASAIEKGDEPFGGVICDSDGNIIVRDGNRENTEQNPTHHAD